MGSLAVWTLVAVLQVWVHDRARVFPRALEAAPPGALLPVPGEIVRRVRAEGNVAILTFDACATQGQANGFDRALYDLLVRERLPAAVFVSGRWIESHPAEFAELAANPLIEIGNHTYDHPHMSQLDEASMKEELLRTNALIAARGRQAIGFRPPFGDLDGNVVRVAGKTGLRTIMWDVVSGDPGKRATKESIEQQVLRRARAGSIIIFHINGRAPHTAEALPDILANLRARGFSFARLSEYLPRGAR